MASKYLALAFTAIMAANGALFAGALEDIQAKGAASVPQVTTTKGLGTVTLTGENTSKEVLRKMGQTVVKDTLTVDIYQVRTVYVPKVVSYEELQCSQSAGNGSTGDWKNAFDRSISSKEKAERLSDAILGVGPASAACVTQYFPGKPQSWTTFKERIKKADDDCAPGVYSRVIVQYGQRNAQNLGYASATDCQVVTVSELVIVPVEDKKYYETRKFPMTITVERGDLLPDEIERFDLRYYDNSLSVSANSKYNTYQITKVDEFNYRAVGTRNKYAPENTLVLDYNGDQIMIKNTQNYAQYDPNAIIYAELEGKQAYGLIHKTLGTKTVRLVNGQGVASVKELTAGLKPGRKYYIKYSMKMTGSKFFSDRASSKKDGIKF